MNYKLIPNIMIFTGLGFAIMLGLVGYYFVMISEKTTDVILAGVITALGAVLILFGLCLMLVFWSLGDSLVLRHHRMILQKHQLWQDESISKRHSKAPADSKSDES